MPFTTLNRETHYQGHAFDVARIHVRLPDGRERDYDLVEHGDSVTILPLDENGNIYFVNQHRIGAEGELLELPAGVLNKDEDPLNCAKREIREEIGMAADHFQKLGGFFLAPGYTDEYMTVFLATGLYEAPLKPDDDEFIDVKSLPAASAYRLAIDGEFHDSKTLAALLLAQPLIKNRDNNINTKLNDF
jgi:ADP-ribose pyrophosphatase